MSNNTVDNEMDTREQMDRDNYFGNNSESKTRTSAEEPLLSTNTWRSTSSQAIVSSLTTSNIQNPSISPTISSSLMNFQMPQNFLLPQVMPNFPNYLPSMPAMPNLPSLPDYLTQLPTLPTVSMPSMPSMPNLSMPSMPNISMPSMPNLPSIPSLSDFMNSFPSRKLIKPWPQLRQAVKSSHRRFSEIGCRVPFMFNWREDIQNKQMRIYFLSSINNSAEITLIYCDISTETTRKRIESNEVHEIESNLNKEVVINAEEVGDDSHEEEESDCEEEFMPMSSSNNLTEAKLTNSVSNKDDERNRKPFWQQLIITSKSNFSFDTEQRNPSREENLQLERKRIMFSGITSYEFQQKSSRFVFTSGDSLFWFDDPLDDSNRKPPYLPNKLESTTSFIKMNPQLCPSDPNLVAYVADGDLWVCNLKSSTEFRLTETKFDNDSGALSAGLPSYVLQEEFRRYTGFWWRPDNEYDHINNSGDLSYTILCEFVDESEVDIVKIASWDGTVEEYRFPRAGQCNAESSLLIITFSLNPLTNLISDVKTASLPKALKEIFPSYEYLVRCGWHSHDNLWLQLLNRAQNHLVLVLMSLHDSYPPQIIHEEKSSKWVNCHDVLHFFNTGEDLTVGSVVKFIWSSEETGFRHLFTVKIKLVGNDCSEEESFGQTVNDNEDTIDAKLPKLDNIPNLEYNPIDSHRSIKSETSVDEENTGGVKSPAISSNSNGCGLNASNSPIDFVSIETKRSKLVEKVQLTHGNWEVSDKEVWIDENNSLIYFTGLKESPLERHLYVISLNFPKIQPKRLTVEDFSHTSIAFNSSFNYFIDIQSNITIPPFGYLQRITSNGNLPDVQPVSLFLGSSAHPGEDNDQIDLLPGMAAPQLFDYRLKSGDLIYGFIFKPECMEAGVRYPVLLEIYGGPEVQLVSKSFKAVRHCRRHLLASEGYIVVAFDSRGSRHRGVSFESHCNRRLGQVEIADQVEALQWLAENTDFIDMSRIAVHGWSYGGYLSLMALAQRPDIFKCAIAGAPVTNWQLYDTGYTERYMDTPQNNPEGYRLGNVMTHINSFPNEENRLLIIHGLMDENVHFAHTVQLIQALVKAGKPYQLNVYPFERHSLRHSQCSEHYETLLLSFLQNNL